MPTIFWKPANIDIYLNWNAFAPDTWKRGTLKTLVEHAYIVCSTNDFLKKEVKYLVKVFHETNNYPHYEIKQILKQVKFRMNKFNKMLIFQQPQKQMKQTLIEKKNIFYLYHIKVKKGTMPLRP